MTTAPTDRDDDEDDDEVVHFQSPLMKVTLEKWPRGFLGFVTSSSLVS
jgi:hypothetical protein